MSDLNDSPTVDGLQHQVNATNNRLINLELDRAAHRRKLDNLDNVTKVLNERVDSAHAEIISEQQRSNVALAVIDEAIDSLRAGAVTDVKLMADIVEMSQMMNKVIDRMDTMIRNIAAELALHARLIEQIHGDAESQRDDFERRQWNKDHGFPEDGSGR